MDNSFNELKLLGLHVGWHVGPTFAGVFGYADDISLIALSLYVLVKLTLYVNHMQNDTTSPSIQQSPC